MQKTIGPILAELESAARKGTVTLQLDRALYPSECIDSARAAFQDFCRVSAVAGVSGRVSIAIQVHSEDAGERRRVVGEFLNYLLDLSAQNRFAELPER